MKKMGLPIQIFLGLFFGIIIGVIFYQNPSIETYLKPMGNISKYVATEQQMAKGGHMDFIINIVPTNVFGAMAKGELLPVIFFSVLLGISLASMGDKAKPVLTFFKSFSEAMVYMVRMILKVVPFGVAFIAGIDFVLNMGRATINVMGNALATIVVTKWENQFDYEKNKEYIVLVDSAVQGS